VNSIRRDRNQAFLQAFTDWCAAASAWTLYYLFRKVWLEPIRFQHSIPIEFDANYYSGLLLIPLFWLVLYQAAGNYHEVFRKSRLGIVGNTLMVCLLGSLVLFFAISLDDFVPSYRYYYSSFLALFGLHTGITFIERAILSTINARKVQTGRIQFNTLLIGAGPKALDIYRKIKEQPVSSGNHFLGYIPVNGSFEPELAQELQNIGSFENLASIIRERDVEEVIVAPENNEHGYLGKILTELEVTNVYIKVIPDITDILLGSVKMSAIFGAPVIEINRVMMPVWQRSLKRLFDIVISLLVLCLFFPVFLVIAIIVKVGSPGPALYSHYRIGLNGKPFRIYKFRSMFIDAEKMGPQLSSKHDSRITPFGRFMRKTRLDEIPQFYNVLIGTMSIVGPRPERQHYIDQIVQVAPHYRILQKVRPGITGWGQVKFGYAENVTEMVERLKYDILYVENMTLALDFKIMIYTALIVLQGRGK
jgi:exopolysaccharide biosynthesis polyprenyl glycosylphosphotransferase